MIINIIICVIIFWQEMKVIQGSDGLKRTKKRGSASVGSKK